MNNVVDMLLVLDGSGTVERINGSYSTYLAMMERRYTEEEQARQAAASAERKAEGKRGAAAVNGARQNGSASGAEYGNEALQGNGSANGSKAAVRSSFM